MTALAVVVGVVVLLGFTVFFGAPYVPSRRKELHLLFKNAYPLSAQDTLVDLGSGDGVVLRTARQYGARAVGYELGPVYFAISKLLARGDKKQIIKMENYWHAKFPKNTTVVYAFSDGRDIAKVAELVQAQANRLQKNLTFITLGAVVPGRRPSQAYRAFAIYRLTPCAPAKA